MSEKRLQSEIMKMLGRGNTRVFRNNIGVAKYKDPKTGKVYNVKYGVGHGLGGSDIIGIRKIKITQEMVGKDIGQFIALEVKFGKGVATDEQKRFIAMINSFGGYAKVIREKGDYDG